MENNLARQLSKLNLYTIQKQGSFKENLTVKVSYKDLEKTIKNTLEKKEKIIPEKLQNFSEQEYLPNQPSVNLSKQSQINIPKFEPMLETTTFFNENIKDNQYELQDNFYQEQYIKKEKISYENQLNSFLPIEKTSSSTYNNCLSPIKSKLLQPGNEFNLSFSWDEKIDEINKQVFKNKSFRSNQREVINAVISNRDTFVIMPTGGGKSLTFQLPAVLSDGVTLVVMPLISLIYDQIQRLNEIGIPAREFNSTQQLTEQNAIYDDIIKTNSIKILFITPEKLSQSEKLNWFLKKLEERGKLARIVIDEAHCVSQWGRDFRKDYSKLSKFRENFPKIPILALTGTATQKVRDDVVEVLQMKNPLIFLSSFNRPNLHYEVRSKNNKAINDMVSLIKKNYQHESGLIYCITKKDCEKVTEKIQKLGIKSDFYHSEIDSAKKSIVQDQWMSGEIQVLVATLAFGMGIDKQAVRFVFHYSLPKSLENYYQESGRAGRDGQASSCIIYYNYSDKYVQDYLISLSNENSAQDINLNELQSMIEYCENIYICRRKQQLNYFGEDFDSKNCNKTCDNCKSGRIGYEKDVTEIAKVIINVLSGDRSFINTMIQVAGFLKGKNTGKKNLTEFDGFGALKDEKLEIIEEIMRKMITLNVLKEKSVSLYNKVHMNKIELGPHYTKVLNNLVKVTIMAEIPKNTEKQKEIHIENLQNKTNYSDLFQDIDFDNFFPEICPVSQDIKKNELRNQEKNNLQSQNISVINNNFSNTPLKAISENFLLNNSAYGKSGSLDAYEEIFFRLNLVRTKLAKQLGKPAKEVLSEEQLISLSKNLPKFDDVPCEFLKEIEYFKKINNIKDSFDFDLELENIDFDTLTVRRLPESISPSNEKKLKINKYPVSSLNLS